MNQHNEEKKLLQLPNLKLVATNIVQIKEGQAMIQKLMLAVTMTFALNSHLVPSLSKGKKAQTCVLQLLHPAWL
jgi:hypothetical protein